MNEPFDPDATVSVWHAADNTAELSPGETPSEPAADDPSLPGYWQPNTRLSGRVSTARTTPKSAERRAWWIAGIIIVVALLVAVALFLAALWIQSNDNDSDDNSGQDAAAMTLPT